MKTIILPGYSLYNKDWAEEVAQKLQENNISTVVHYWKHWQKESSSMSLGKELQDLRKEVSDLEVNFIAKSVGTFVLAKLLPWIKKQVNKIILCGIPSVSEVRSKIYKGVLCDFPSQNILVFQNENDPFASFQEVRRFIRLINPKIKVIKKPASDHNYPYVEDFLNFLKVPQG